MDLLKELLKFATGISSDYGAVKDVGFSKDVGNNSTFLVSVYLSKSGSDELALSESS